MCDPDEKLAKELRKINSKLMLMESDLLNIKQMIGARPTTLQLFAGVTLGLLLASAILEITRAWA